MTFEPGRNDYRSFNNEQQKTAHCMAWCNHVGGGVEWSGARIWSGAWVWFWLLLLLAWRASGHPKRPRLMEDDPWSHAPIWVKLVRVHEERVPLLPCSWWHAPMLPHACSRLCRLSTGLLCPARPPVNMAASVPPY